jgi:hypothetical protein
MKTSKFKKRMSSGSSLTSKLYDKIIKMLSKSHETIPLSTTRFTVLQNWIYKISSHSLFITHLHRFMKSILFLFGGEWGCFWFVWKFRKMRKFLKTIDLLWTMNIKKQKRESTCWNILSLQYMYICIIYYI